MLYISFYFLLFLFALSHGKRNARLFNVSFFALLVITCLRAYSIGIDTAGGYYSYYRQVLGGGNLSWVEPTWVILNRICIWLGLGYSGVIAVSGLLTIIPVYYVIKNTCNNRCYALAVYYGLYLVLYSFNMMRQCIAISFALLAIYYYINRRYYRAAIWLLFGFMFHNSAVVVLALVLFLRLDIKFLRTLLLLIITYVSGLLLSNRVFFIIAGQYANNLLLTDGYSGFRTSIIVPALFTAAFNVFFIITILPEYERIKRNPWYLVTLLGVIAMNLTMRLGQGTRIILYFSQAQMIFIPNYIGQIENKGNKKILAALYFLYLAANFYRILNSQWDTVVPYMFFWEQ